MLRRASCLLVAVVLAFAAPASQAKGASPLASAAAKARSDFAARVRGAEGILAQATGNLQSALAAKTIAPVTAATNFGNAFGFFCATVEKAADEASSSFATAASEVMTAASDPTLKGALAGDGGTLDALSDSIDGDLAAVRRRAIARARKFGKSLAAGTARTTFDVSLPQWTFERTSAPSSAGPVAPADAPIRLSAALAAKLDSGAVVVSLAGTAPRSQNGRFDARLVAGTDIRIVGPALSAGGMPVSLDGTWYVTATLNDPGAGQAVAAGNRSVQFGVDPLDMGPPAGLQPTRHQQGGVIGIR
jgi:hypothetical protein